jgi:hypothetical protein
MASLPSSVTIPRASTIPLEGWLRVAGVGVRAPLERGRRGRYSVSSSLVLEDSIGVLHVSTSLFFHAHQIVVVCRLD